MLQKAVHVYARPLNIYKAVTDVEVIGERGSKLGRFPKSFACCPCRKPSLHHWWDPWWCRHGAVVQAEQREDTPKGNKVNAPLKKTHNRTTSPSPSLSQRWPGCTQAAICFCRHGKCKAQQLCFTYCFYSPSPSLYFFAETANKRADQWLCRCHCPQRQEGRGGSSPSTVPRGTEEGQASGPLPYFGT